MKKTIILPTTLILFLGLILVLPDLPRSPVPDFASPLPEPPPSQGELRRAGNFEDLTARHAYDLLRLADPATGRIPPDIRRLEQEFAAQLPTATDKVDGIPFTPDWASRGPWKLGGRTRALAFDVGDPTHQTILAGGVSGGMWRSVDQGDSWTQTTGSSMVHNVNCLAQDTRPGHTDVWYYGTGEVYGSSASYPVPMLMTGDGVFKSTDGGLTWSVLGSTTGFDPERPSSPWQYVYRLAVDPSNPVDDEIYAATWGGIHRSVDGGQNWTHVLGSTGDPASYTELAVTSTGVVYATLSYDGTVHGAFRSTDGLTWTDITPPGVTDYDRIVMAVAPSDEDVVWFLSANNFQTPDAALYRYEYISGDGSGTGGAWEDRSPILQGLLPGPRGATHYESQGGYCQMLKVHPSDSETLFLGGVFMYRSTDGFQTAGNVTLIGGHTYQLHHADLHELVFRPGSVDVALTGSDGGIHLTNLVNHASVSWIPRNTGYNTSQFYTMAIDENLPGSDVVIGGTQDNGTRFGVLDSPQAEWTHPLGADGGYCAVADASGYIGTYYASWQQGYGIFRLGIRNSDGQVSGQTIVNPAGGTTSLWLWPFTLDPADTDVMFLACDDHLWRNSNLSAIPQGNSAPTPVNWTDRFTVPSGSLITTLTVSRSPSRTLWFGTADGELYKLDLAFADIPGFEPVRLDVGAGFPAGAYISSIAVNAEDDQDVLVGFSNYRVANLFHTTDGGATWTDVEGNLAGADSPSVRSVACLPTPAITYYLVGTSTGLYSTHELDGASTVWRHQAPDLIGNVVVDMIKVRPADLLVMVGTHGRGVFRGLLGVSAVEDTPALGMPRLAQNVPNPFNPSTAISFTLAEPGSGALDIFDVAGRRVRTLWRGDREAGTHTFEWDGRDDSGHALGSGTYLYRLRTEEGELSRSMTLVR